MFRALLNFIAFMFSLMQKSTQINNTKQNAWIQNLSHLDSKMYINHDSVNDSDMPTAHKSSIEEQSPSRGNISSPNLKSSSRYTHRIQQAKNSIGSIIHELDAKREVNKNGVEGVSRVNRQAIDMLSNMKGQNRDDEYQGYRADRANRNTGHFGKPKSEEHLNPEAMTLEEENLQLRKALNDQIKHNNMLLQRINFLQRENEDLKSQLNMTSSKRVPSTNFNSVNYGHGPHSQMDHSKHSPATAKFANKNVAYDFEEDVHPLDFGQGHRPQSHYSKQPNQNLNTNMNMEYQQIMAQLNSLKRQNEALRQGAISMLKRN